MNLFRKHCPRLLAGGLLAATMSCSREAVLPSLVVISIDTLRADHLGCYGHDPYGIPVSPAIDALAAEGLRFERCFTPRGQTAPSLCSMMTGRFPSSHGVRENAQNYVGDPATLAGILGQAGYDTAGFAAYLPTGPGGSPLKGFAVGEEMAKVHQDPLFEMGQPEWDRQAAQRSVEFLRSRREAGKPFFLWTHFYQVHRPYAPPAPYDRMFRGDYSGPLLLPEGASDKQKYDVDVFVCRKILADEPLSPEDHRYVLGLYDGGIRSVDDEVKAVLDALEEAGLADETLVVLTSDHGDDLGQHSNYYFHGNSVYDSTLRIPLILRWPGRIAAGTTASQLMQNVDLAPTLLALMGVAVPDPGFEGVSFAEVVRSGGGAGSPRTWVHSEWQDLISCVRSEEWKYVFNPQGIHPKKPPYFNLPESVGFRVRCEELYRVADDPDEQHDVVREQPAVVRELRDMIALFQERPGHLTSWPTEVDPETLEHLRAQGYVASLPGRPDVVFNAEKCE